MNLLSQEEGAALKPGDVVNVYWFTPRKPKGEERESRVWDGRQEWVETVWRSCVVGSHPYATASDGLVVRLRGMPCAAYCVSRMEVA